MQNNDINHLDTNDEGLAQIFGSRFVDESGKPKAAKTATKRNPTSAKKPTPVVEEAPRDEPILVANEKERTLDWMEKLQTVVHKVIPVAALCTFFFWCQLTERMDYITSIWAMVFCVAYMAFNVGRICAK